MAESASVDLMIRVQSEGQRSSVVSMLVSLGKGKKHPHELSAQHPVS